MRDASRTLHRHAPESPLFAAICNRESTEIRRDRSHIRPALNLRRVLEERERAYKQGLGERLEKQIPSDERIDSLAVCQVGMAPAIQVVPMVIGIGVLLVSLFAGSTPKWVGLAGALLVVAGIVVMLRTPRRLLARTNRAVHVFVMPRSQKVEFEKPAASVPVAELPEYEGGAVELGGERLWPNYGSGIERDALAAVLKRSS